MTFARWLFRIAGILGLLLLLPQYFMEEKLGSDYPPAITHPEYFYGFVGVAAAWQVAFLLIARNPSRYRLLMIPAVLEKFSFGIPAVILVFQHRSPVAVLGFGLMDLAFGVAFCVAYVVVGSHKNADSA